MQIDLAGSIIIVGGYGSGKTEIAVNLAVHQHRRGINVRIADLDLVNPYFRTRDVRKFLTAMGIDVIVPPDSWMQADLPLLMPQVAGMIKAPGDLAIIDVGGDDVGATVLASLADAIKGIKGPKKMIQVVNPFRPTTHTVEGCLKMRRSIETNARIPIDTVLCNAHMLDETTVEHVYHGDALMVSLNKVGNLSVECITVPSHLINQIDSARLNWPVLPIYRQLVPPWRKAEEFPRG